MSTISCDMLSTSCHQRNNQSVRNIQHRLQGLCRKLTASDGDADSLSLKQFLKAVGYNIRSHCMGQWVRQMKLWTCIRLNRWVCFTVWQYSMVDLYERSLHVTFSCINFALCNCTMSYLFRIDLFKSCWLKMILSLLVLFTVGILTMANLSYVRGHFYQGRLFLVAVLIVGIFFRGRFFRRRFYHERYFLNL